MDICHKGKLVIKKLQPAKFYILILTGRAAILIQ